MLHTMRARATARKAEGGFSLIELLIVMVIIAILVLIAIPAISQYRENARVAAVQSDARNLGTALEGRYTLTQAYPLAANVKQVGQNLVDDRGDADATNDIVLGRLSSGVALASYTVNAAGDKATLVLQHTQVGAATDTFGKDFFQYVTDAGVSNKAS